MLRRLVPACLLALSAFVLQPASAWAGGHRGSCSVVCCTPCAPCFNFGARLDKPSPYIPPDPIYKLPLEVYVTNWECYGWEYLSSEYRYYVFDDCGNYVPDVMVLPYEYRPIYVPPCVSVLDRPTVSIRANKLQLGRRYTIVIGLRCHWASVHVIPFLEKKSSETSALERSSLLVVTLPSDARLTINDCPTGSTSAKRIFQTPPLPAGKENEYVLSAQFIRDGHTRNITRRVTVSPGTELHVDLTETDAVAWTKVPLKP